MRKLLLIAVVMLLILAAAACGKVDNSGKDESSSESVSYSVSPGAYDPNETPIIPVKPDRTQTSVSSSTDKAVTGKTETRDSTVTVTAWSGSKTPSANRPTEIVETDPMETPII